MNQRGWLDGRKAMLKRVILETPFAGRTPDESARNLRYARACLRDTVRRGESAIASHLLWTQVLDDKDPDERKQGIDCGLVWGDVADYWVVYTDLGLSLGMCEGMDRADKLGKMIEIRKLPGFDEKFSAPQRSQGGEIAIPVELIPTEALVGIDHNHLIKEALRHITAHTRGEQADLKSGFSHVDHAQCCLHLLNASINATRDPDGLI